MSSTVLVLSELDTESNISANKSSNVVLPFDTESYIPEKYPQFRPVRADIAEIMDKLIEQSSVPSESIEIEKIETIIDFSRTLLENSKDIESEIAELVNEHFWDLI